jgi:hypothetical protein
MQNLNLLTGVIPYIYRHFVYSFFPDSHARTLANGQGLMAIVA